MCVCVSVHDSDFGWENEVKDHPESEKISQIIKLQSSFHLTAFD